MVKLLFATTLIATTLIANALKDKIVNLTGEQTYQKHLVLINSLFKGKERIYIANGYPDTLKITQTLQNNGLFKLLYPKAVTMSVTFEAYQTDALALTISSIKQSLKAIGYGFFTIKQVKYANTLKWTVNFETKFAINPTLLNKELLARGIHIVDIIRRGDTQWVYQLDTSTIKLPKTKKIQKGTNEFMKPHLGEFVIEPIDGSTGFAQARIYSAKGNTWYPYIVCYDKKMNVLQIIKNEKITNQVTLPIPIDTAYIKVADLYTKNNVKHGFRIFLD